jgi:monoterpene epsilon-lactone hydrolase
MARTTPTIAHACQDEEETDMASQENLRARQILSDLRAILAPPDREPTIDQLRAGYDTWLTSNFPAPAELRTEPVDADGVAAVWAAMPSTSAGRTIFYLHGGGYMVGSPAGYHAFAAALSQAADARVLLVDYRLAPEYRHPAGVHDVTRAYRWLVKQVPDPGSIVVAGDSAGAGLVVAMLAALRDAGERLPAGAVCLSPWTDLTLSGASIDATAEIDPIVSRAMLENMAGAYLMGDDPRTASPLFTDHTGFPPTLVLVGASEALLDDATQFADKAREAGVDVTLLVADEMYHLWPVMSSFLPEAREAVERIGRFVRERTAEAHAR